MTSLFSKTLVVLFFFMLTSESNAQVPRTLSLQGVIMNSFDSKFMEGTHIIKVGIYESALGGFPDIMFTTD